MENDTSLPAAKRRWRWSRRKRHSGELCWRAECEPHRPNEHLHSEPPVAPRTADGYLGLLFRRPPFVKVPEGANGLGKAMRAFINDADMLGTSLGNYAWNVAREVIGVGRAGTLIDWEGESENRVYASLYTAENILNWHVERIHGRNVLTLLVLHEAVRSIGEEELGGAPGVHVSFK